MGHLEKKCESNMCQYLYLVFIHIAPIVTTRTMKICILLMFNLVLFDWSVRSQDFEIDQ